MGELFDEHIMNKKKHLKKAKYALRWLLDMVYIQLYNFGFSGEFCNLKVPQIGSEHNGMYRGG